MTEVKEQSDPEILLARAHEVIKTNEKSNGRFFRYTSLSNLNRLLETGQLDSNPQEQFNNLNSEKYNPVHLNPEIIVSFYLLKVLGKFTASVPSLAQGNTLKELSQQATVFSKLDQIENELILQDPKYAGLSQVVKASCASKSTEGIVEYLRKIGGDSLLIKLEKSGWDVYPDGAFSDFMPLSVAAPLGQPNSSEIVILELDFDNSDISIPSDDRNNEHEVMTRKIELKNLRGVYSQQNWPELWAKLEIRYPEHFKDRDSEALIDFARKKPLIELLDELAIA